MPNPYDQGYWDADILLGPRPNQTGRPVARRPHQKLSDVATQALLRLILGSHDWESIEDSDQYAAGFTARWKER